MRFVTELLGPPIFGWLITGLALVILLPIGALREWVQDRRWDYVLLGPLGWFGYRRDLQLAGASQATSDIRNPIATLVLWTVMMALTAAWLGFEFAKRMARMAAEGTWQGDNVDIYSGLFLMRVSPLALAWIAMSAILLFDLAAVLGRRARQRPTETGP